MPTPPLPLGVASLAEIDVSGLYGGTETVVIQGLVSASNQSGWPLREGGHEVHCFGFSHWRRIGGPVIARELLIFRAAPTRVDLLNDIPAHSIQRFSAWLSIDETRAIVQNVWPVDVPDEELLAASDDHRKPVVVPSTRFGLLELDRTTESFTVTADWNGQPAELTIAADRDRPDATALGTADELWSRQPQWAERILSYAADELLDLRNGDWRPEEAPTLTAAQFMAALTVTAISTDASGEFHCWFKESELTFVVRGNRIDGPVDATLFG